MGCMVNAGNFTWADVVNKSRNMLLKMLSESDDQKKISKDIKRVFTSRSINALNSIQVQRISKSEAEVSNDSDSGSEAGSDTGSDTGSEDSDSGSEDSESGSESGSESDSDDSDSDSSEDEEKDNRKTPPAKTARKRNSATSTKMTAAKRRRYDNCAT